MTARRWMIPGFCVWRWSTWPSAVASLPNMPKTVRWHAGATCTKGPISSRLGIPGLPAVAEEVVVARDLALAGLTGVRYHVQHVSSSGTIPLIRRAREAGVQVTAEVTPHHVSLDHERVISMEPRYKMYPPLRAPADVAALRDALIEGLIDAVATDHAPHSAFETEVTFEEAPRGVIGLETAAAAINTAVGMGPGISSPGCQFSQP